jgi:hypothetical protein
MVEFIKSLASNSNIANNLEELKFGGNKLGATGSTELCFFLEKAKVLRILDMSNSDADFSVMATKVKKFFL